MDKEIAQQILTALRSGADLVSAELVSAELPLVAAQLINWIIAERSIWVILALIAGTISIKCHRWCNSLHRPASETEVVYWVLAFIFGISSVPIFLCNLFGLVKVLVAPKIVLIEYLAWFVK